VTKKTDFGSEESFIFTTPSGLWVIINDCAYKLKNPKIDNFNFDYGRKTKTFNHQLMYTGSCSTVSIPDIYSTPVHGFVKYEEGEETEPKKINISLEISSDVVETAHIDKLHQIFSSEDVKAVSKIMSRKFDSMGEE